MELARAQETEVACSAAGEGAAARRAMPCARRERAAVGCVCACSHGARAERRRWKDGFKFSGVTVRKLGLI